MPEHTPPRSPVEGADLDPSDRPELLAVLESAARLQGLVPDTVLVGGSVAALYAGHRLSYDHDHVLNDLSARFDAVLDALDREPEWVMNRVTPGKIVLGSLGDIEAGVRQLIRQRPLEVQEVRLPSGRTLRVPTLDEAIRIKAFLIVRRNQTRDFLDVAALTDRLGVEPSAAVLSRIDDWYADQVQDGVPVATQVARQLADPRPQDLGQVDLATYKQLDPQWADWRQVASQVGAVAAAMELEGTEA